MGFDSKVRPILSKWNGAPLVSKTKPIVECQYAYPENLIEEVSILLLTGLREAGFSIVSSEQSGKNDHEDVMAVLNEAWIRFWKKPDMFRDWGERTIKKLKSTPQR